MFSYHYSKLLGLSQVIVFILHVSEDIHLLGFWQQFDQALRDNESEIQMTIKITYSIFVLLNVSHTAL